MSISLNNQTLVDLLKDGISSRIKECVINELKKELMEEFEKELDSRIREEVKSFVIGDVEAARDFLELTDKYFINITLNGEEL